MRSILAVSLIVIAAAFLSFGIVLSDADADANGVLLYEVNATGDDEGVSIHNYSSKSIDLKGYTISDNPSLSSKEGYIEFTESLIIRSGETITVVSKDLEGSKFIGRHTTYYDGMNGVKYQKSFALSNSGDDVYLIKDGRILDAFCYGSVTPSDKTVWSGDSFKIKTKCFAARNDTDTNTANDWYNFKIGWTNIQFDPEVKFDATVTPFLFPDSGGIPIYNALEDAKSNVCITLYLLTSKNMCGLLNELLKKGIDITLLLEEKPLGYTSDLNSIQTLINNGAKVMFINSSDDNDRYVYVHAKYCIIDDKTTIIMSENWVTDNLSGVATDIYASGVDISKVKGNRGWGAIVESADYANYMKKIFENDCDKSYGDVRDFSDVYSNVTPYTPTYSKPSSTLSLSSYDCQVTPMFSPDSSWDGTNYYISTATDRIYAENQSLTASYTDVSNTSPIKYMAEKAASGVDTRFIINDNESVALEINQKTLIKTASMKTPYVHNKGLICDDMALVSSVNWTDTSFNSNREMCVAILSKDIADYFANAFLSDFNANYTYLGLDVKVSEISEHYDEAGVITVSVDVEQDGTYTYYWDLDGTTKTTTVARTTLDVGEGSHTLNVTVTDTTGTTGLVTSSFTVGNDDTNHLDVSGLIDSVRPYIIPIIVVILAILIAIVKSASGGNKKSKGGKKKR